jgi:FAD/FMN-containing dehydrogenase
MRFLLFRKKKDGNLHCNVVTPGVFEEDPDVLAYVEQCVFDAVVKRNGSISAEHGLGQYKNNKLSKIKDPATLRSMFAIKRLFDPRGILNPGKYLPTSE